MRLVPVVAAITCAAAIEVYGAQKICCEIIRVNAEKGAVWVRNPQSGLLAEFHPGPEDIAKFKVGDQFNPDTNILNGAKLSSTFAYVEAELEPPNATVIRARGAEVAAKMNESGTVHRFYLPKFGAILSSLKPGQEILIDETGRWAIIRWASRSGTSVMGDRSKKLKPQTYVFKLD